MEAEKYDRRAREILIIIRELYWVEKLSRSASASAGRSILPERTATARRNSGLLYVPTNSATMLKRDLEAARIPIVKCISQFSLNITLRS